jgi:mono/diheme cytochrome c family protein
MGKMLDMMRFLAGVVAVIVAGALLGLAAVWFGFVPAAADAPPASGLEKWAARRALNATIRREMPQPPYPLSPATDATILAGAKLYMTNCSVCHGSGTGDASKVAKGLYIPPPQFVTDGVDDDPEGKIYWQIEHGIRFTGMPAFKGALSEDEIWQIVGFLKRPAGQLPAAAAAVWTQPHGD